VATTSIDALLDSLCGAAGHDQPGAGARSVRVTGPVLALVGTAGLGKSTLLALAARRARAGSIDVLEAGGTPGTEDRPLAPLLELLDLDPSEDPDRRLVEAPLGDPMVLLVQRAVDLLDRRAEARPTLLLLDDAHWVDTATLLLVQHLAVRSSGPPLAVVLATREPAPGSTLERLVTDLGDSVLRLDHLDDDAITAVAAARLGHDVGPGLAQALRRADGNPMLAVSMLDALVHDGAIAIDDQGAELRKDRPAGGTGSGVDVLGDQLATIGPDALDVLRLAALIDGPLRFEVLARALRRSPVGVARALGPALDAGLLVEDEDRVVFRHDLHREAVLASMNDQERRTAHARLADVLAELGAPVLAVAEHYAAGASRGDRPAARHLAAAAADVVGAAPALALRLCEAAVALAPGVEGDLGLAVTRVRALAGTGRTAEAEALATQLLATTLDPEVEARIRRELALAAFITGRPAEASQQMGRVVDLAGDPRQRATALAERAWATMLALDGDAARADATAAIELGTAAGAVDAVVMARAVRCWLDLWAADYRAATADADALVQSLEHAPPGPWQAVQPWLAVAAVRLDVDDDEAAITAATTGRRLAADTGSGWAVAVHDALLADLYLRTGELDEAMSAARSAIAGTALVDGMGVELWARASLAHTLIELGDLDAAELELATAEVALDDGRAQLGLERFLLARASVHEARGRLVEAHTTYRSAWELMSAIGIRYVLPSLAPGVLRTAAVLAADAATAADPSLVLDPRPMLATLEQIAGPTAPFSQRFHRDHARVWVEGEPLAELLSFDPPEEARRPGMSRAARRDLAAVRAGASRLQLEPAPGTAPLLGTGSGGLDSTAALGVQDGSGSAHGTNGTTPVPTSRAAGDPSVSPVRPAADPLVVLTPAERRVAELVATGLTNTQIAAQLMVSRRTVDSHVLAAYRKLGVASRVALTRTILHEVAS
jgi:DNA-binding CsgD family transcriptional regulator/tetratricopeptide (TPR) repeat protein